MANLLLFYCKTWLFSKVQNCIFFSMCVDFSCRRTLTFHRANEFELERVMIRFPGLKMNSLKGKWKKKKQLLLALKRRRRRRSTHTAFRSLSEYLWANTWNRCQFVNLRQVFTLFSSTDLETRQQHCHIHVQHEDPGHFSFNEINGNQNTKGTQCLKITKNVSFKKKLAKLTNFGIFDELLS